MRKQRTLRDNSRPEIDRLESRSRLGQRAFYKKCIMESHSTMCLKQRDSVAAAVNASSDEKREKEVRDAENKQSLPILSPVLPPHTTAQEDTEGASPPCTVLLPSGSLQVEDEAEMMEQKTVIGLRMAQGALVWVKEVPGVGEGCAQLLDSPEVETGEWRQPVESVAAWRVQLSAMSMEPEQLPFMEEKYLPGPHLAAVAASTQAP